jgi:transposase-like protein
MKWLGHAGEMTPEPATYPGYRFPAEIISHAVWLYHVFGLSLREVELILAERGITVKIAEEVGLDDGVTALQQLGLIRAA